MPTSRPCPFFRPGPMALDDRPPAPVQTPSLPPGFWLRWYSSGFNIKQ